jgi:hypothetical protein
MIHTKRQIGWRPSELSWRIATLFMVGAFLFAIGSLPAYAANIDGRVVGATFVVGSVFFTAASYSQFFEAINDKDATTTTRRRYWAIRSGDLVWWATVIQLAGTIFFNISTSAAMIETLDIEETNRLVWGPDMFGSAAFLIASHLAWLVVCGQLWKVLRDDVNWWIAAVNYLGSIFFIAAAIASFTLPTTGEAVDIVIVNAATFGGAVCFFAGAYLLLPAAASDPAPG